MANNSDQQSSQQIDVYDFVWAKLLGYPPLPGMVMNPRENGPPNERADDYWIYFFYSHEYSWVERCNVEHYEARKDFYTVKYKRLDFKRGVKELDELIENMRNDPQHKIKFIQERNEDTINLKKIPHQQFRAMKRVRAEETEIMASLENPSFEIAEPPTKPRRITGNTSKKAFGILAGNIISVGIIKNMLEAGHRLNLYYSTELKWDEKLKAIIVEYKDKSEWLNILSTPNEVAIRSDIILSCQASDQDCKITASTLGNSIQNKQYVEMSSIGPDASIELQTILEEYNVTYMETMIQGGRRAAFNKTLMLIACGNQELYNQCEPCFKSISELYFFLTNSNAATKCHSILQMLRGVFVGAVSEAVGLAEAYGISADQFSEMFSKTRLSTKYLEEKLNMFMDGNDTEVDEQVQNLQSDLYQGIIFSGRVKCPVSIAAPANEKFKEACAKGKRAEDVSCLFNSF